MAEPSLAVREDLFQEGPRRTSSLGMANDLGWWRRALREVGLCRNPVPPGRELIRHTLITASQSPLTSSFEFR